MFFVYAEGDKTNSKHDFPIRNEIEIKATQAASALENFVAFPSIFIDDSYKRRATPRNRDSMTF